MQPQTPATSGFTPKYRNFHPMDRIWVTNPFDHDVVFQVADEMNRPFQYRLQAHKVSELPGGAIATLGVKHIVDELIQNEPTEQMLMWDPGVRKKYEDQIILREKRANVAQDQSKPGEIDLSVKSTDLPEEEVAAPEQEEEAFPGLNAEPVAEVPALAPLPPSAQSGLADVVAASLPTADAVTEPQ